MTKIEKLRYFSQALCIYKFEDDDVFDALVAMLCADDDERVEAHSNFFKALSDKGSLKQHISKLILTNDNVFSRAACALQTDKLPIAIINAIKSDLSKLEELSSVTAQDLLSEIDDKSVKEIMLTMPGWEVGTPLPPLEADWDKSVEKLVHYYNENGYGVFAQSKAFAWRDEELCPVSSVDPIRLTDLKNYELQRKQVIDNTEHFLAGHPANNILLYGDRGTGKSSTVHAILNEYASKGLRMIEITKGDVAELSLIREQIADSPLKFIIFIDDLSFDSHEDSFAELKAALEGSLSGRQANTLIYATSNRRHLIKENFSDRENDVNKGDTMQEQVSLSDRFGLSITFINPNKADYLDIVEKIAIDRGLDKRVDMDKLCFMAERWSVRRGGRSPRCAKQFIDYVEGCENSKKQWY